MAAGRSGEHQISFKFRAQWFQLEHLWSESEINSAKATDGKAHG